MLAFIRQILRKCKFNLFPAFRGTGGRVVSIADDWSEIKIKLPLNWRTKNYVGTIFGGSLYASVDPFYMLILIKILGPDYIVWDKTAQIRFLKPGRSTLYATFQIDQEEIQTIRQLLEHERSIDRVYSVDLIDEKAGVHARVEKTIYIRKRESHGKTKA